MADIKKITVDPALEERLQSQTTCELITEIYQESHLTRAEISALTWISSDTIAKWLISASNKRERRVNPPPHVVRYLKICIDDVLLPPQKNKDVIRNMSKSDMEALLCGIQEKARANSDEYNDIKAYLNETTLFKPMVFLSADERKSYIREECAKSEQAKKDFDRQHPTNDDYISALSSLLKQYNLIYRELADICFMKHDVIAKYIIGNRKMQPWKVRYMIRCVKDYFKREQSSFSNNYDRIRSMSDDELEWLLSYVRDTAKAAAIPNELKSCHDFLNGLELLTINYMGRRVNEHS